MESLISKFEEAFKNIGDEDINSTLWIFFPLTT